MFTIRFVSYHEWLTALLIQTNPTQGSLLCTTKELGLKVGSDAYAVIKATNVMVGIDE